MRKHLILPALVLPLFAAGQFTIDFEGTNGGDTTFTAGGIEWTMTGDFNCDSYDEFFCGEGTGLNRYMDSGWEDGASEGYMGSLKPTDPNVIFQLGTDTATMCIWPASVDGLFPGEGTVTFAGILPDGSSIAETMELATEDYSLASYLFDSENWSGVDILELTVTIEEATAIWITLFLTTSRLHRRERFRGCRCQAQPQSHFIRIPPAVKSLSPSRSPTLWSSTSLASK